MTDEAQTWLLRWVLRIRCERCHRSLLSQCGKRAASTNRPLTTFLVDLHVLYVNVAQLFNYRVGRIISSQYFNIIIAEFLSFVLSLRLTIGHQVVFIIDPRHSNSRFLPGRLHQWDNLALLQHSDCLKWPACLAYVLLCLLHSRLEIELLKRRVCIQRCRFDLIVILA